MNKTLNTSHLGGMPVTQEAIAHMQASYVEAFRGIASEFGDMVIFSGVADQGANWGDGWIVANGKLIPFKGGIKSPRVKIQTDTLFRQYEDGLSKEMYYTEYASLSITEGFLFTDLTRLPTIKDLALGAFHPGMSIIWEGLLSEIPVGWALSERLNNGKVLVGLNVADSDYDTPGKTGGSKTMTLAPANLPELKITVGDSFTGTASPGDKLVAGRGKNNSNFIYLKQGGATAFDIRQDYYVVAYITKL